MKNDFNYEEYFNKIFSTFDSLDLLTKFSSLNLIFENQNKNIYTTYLTNYSLFNQNSNKPRCSSKTFKELINRVQEIPNLSMQIDPSESSFFEYVLLDKKYGVFNGINMSSAYYINMIIQMLIYRKTSLPKEFKSRVLHYLKVGLTISDIIFKRVNISFDDIADHQYVEKIIVPPNLDKLKNIVCFNKNEIFELISEGEFEKYFVIDITNQSLENVTSSLFPFYYDFPFIVYGDEIIIVDPTSICYFLKKLCLRLSDEYHCKELFIKEYNNCVASFSFDLCKTISGINFLSNKILGTDTDIFKCSVFECQSNKAVLFICACNTISDDENGEITDLQFTYDELINKAFDELDKIGFSKENIYTFIIFSSITGSFAFKTNVEFVHKPVIVPSSELEIIQINESKNPLFLQSFSELLDFYFTPYSLSMIYSMTNLISMISERDYDLYLGDDVRVKGTHLNLTFDFIYPYTVNALRKMQNNVSLFEGINDPIRLIKYEENIYFNNPIICPIVNVKPMYLQLENFGIWALSNIGDENGVLITRTVLYWLNQINTTISKFISHDLYIQILNGSEYSVHLTTTNKCLVKYTKENITSHDNSDNTNEISIVIDILKTFELFNNDVENALIQKSNIKNKKIIYMLNIESDQTSKPLKESIIPIRTEKIIESIIDDKIGEYLVDCLKLPFGEIDNPSELLKTVVEFVFKDFETYIKKFEWLSSIKKCYLFIENFVQELSLFQDNMKHQVILYPEHEKDISENYNRINTSSVALRFVVEYIGSIRPNGKETMSDFDVEYAMSIASAIVKWARIDDAFKYGLIEKADLLKSYRIGFDHAKLNKFNEIITEVVSFDTSHKLDFKLLEKGTWPFKTYLDNAYMYEHGFTTNDIMRVILLFLNIGNKQEEEIKQANINEFYSLMESDNKIGVSKELFLKVVDYISIGKREIFYDKTIKPRELHPWKYNRAYSLLRKPIIRCDEFYIWGNRMVEHLYYHLMNTIFNGKEPSSKDGKLSINTLNGKILEFSGNEFNDLCFEYLIKKVREVDFYKCVKSINNKRIENAQKEFLGDIDILGIDKSKKKIYLIETKNFFYSRDPSELDIEIKEMFIDTPKKRCFLTKEINRLTWVKNHIDDVINEYDLESGDWKIRYTFLTDKPLISVEFSDRKINATSLKLINLKYLRNLKD